MRVEQENPTPSIVNIAKSARAAGVSVIRAFNDRRAIDVTATHRSRLKARCADSESRFLAIKKFSRRPASRLIAARQNRFFARIATADSRRDFWFVRCIAARGERSMHACVRIGRGGGDDAGVTSRDVQIPSLDLSRSLTACGLALPPDDFITWPTNQPIIAGLAFACATLSGLAAMMSSTTFSIAPTSET